MDEWICKKCKKYRRFNPSTLKLGQIVSFYHYEVIAGMQNTLIKNGVILKIKNRILTVLDNGLILYFKDTQVYPLDAPAQLVYKIFGECRCLGR
ncbi:hypothetical protein [Acinetobacter vivianii]|uniref:hypothetical protein n=1 Tax=Acinetobacter vivianii TaxID=1776742 RepID=UPI002DB9D3DD|nr:hypothetical protein [Acinetobacter vivianii]MEB6479479.1 hypothetical protein [Acinetobacter vivianii]MEB6656691.1 hypothetical protein [Acinetobacter vivianii]